MKTLCSLVLIFFALSCVDSGQSERKDFLSKVQTLLDDGKNEEAIQVLAQALLDEPEDHDYTLLLAEAYLRVGGMDLYDVYSQIKAIHDETIENLENPRSDNSESFIPIEKLTKLYDSQKFRLLENLISLFSSFRYDDSLKIKPELTDDEKDIAIHETLARLIYLFFSLTEFIEMLEIIQTFLPEVKDKIQEEIDTINFKDVQSFTPERLADTVKNHSQDLSLQSFSDLKMDLQAETKKIAQEKKESLNIKGKLKSLEDDYAEPVARLKYLIKKIDLNLRELILIYIAIDGALKAKLDRIFEKDEVEINIRGIDYILSWKDGLEQGIENLIKEILSDERHPELEMLANLQRFQRILEDIKENGSLEDFLAGTSLDSFFDSKKAEEIAQEVRESVENMKKTLTKLKADPEIKKEIESRIKTLELSLEQVEQSEVPTKKLDDAKKNIRKIPGHDLP